MRRQITYIEFVRGIQRYFPALDSTNESAMVGLFDRININADDNVISFFEFEKAVQEQSQSVDVAPVLQKIRQAVKFTDEEDLAREFQRIDLDHNQLLDQSEFRRALQRYDIPILEEELKTLFRYFDKASSRYINYHQFVSMLMKNHLNFELIKQRVNAYLASNNVSLQAFWYRATDGGELMSSRHLDRAMQLVGLQFVEDQLDEAFQLIDRDKSSFITLEEFEDALIGLAIDVVAVLTKWRRSLVRKKADLPRLFREADLREHRGRLEQTVSFFAFSYALKQALEDLPAQAEIQAVFNHFTAEKKQQQINYSSFLFEMTNQPTDVSRIILKTQQFR